MPFRPRISILNALLLMTIIGLSLVVFQLWREVVPLRVANRAMRTELGFLNIEDPNKSLAISVPTNRNHEWRWRVYLPPGGQYSISAYTGNLPDQGKLQGKAWVDAARLTGSGISSSGSNLQGEFLIDARIDKEDGHWTFRVNPAGSMTISEPPDDWLSVDGSTSVVSSISNKSQTEFQPGQPIILMHLSKRPMVKLPGGGRSSTPPTGSAEGIALWIEQMPPVPTPPPSAEPVKVN